MADTWGEPKKKIVAAFAAVADKESGAQRTVKGVPGGLIWNVRYEGESPAWSVFIGEPVAGEEVSVRLLTSVSTNGTEYKTWFTEEAYKLKVAAPAGGGQGGARTRDYSIENRQIGLQCAVQHMRASGQSWDKRTVCQLGLVYADFIKTGNLPPAKES